MVADSLTAFNKSFRSAIRAAKGCLSVGDLQVGAKIIERLAEHQAQLQAATQDIDHETDSSGYGLYTELHLLQLTLVCEEEEHWTPRLICLGMEERAPRHGRALL